MGVMIAPISEPLNVKAGPRVNCPGKDKSSRGSRVRGGKGRSKGKPVPEAESGWEPGPAEVRQWQAASCQLKIKPLLQQWRKSRGCTAPPHPPRQEKAICSQARLREAWLGDNGMGCAAGSIMILRIRAHIQNGVWFFIVVVWVFFFFFG